MAPAVEISIPNTQTSSTSKPYTLYNITLRLPIRSFIVRKRYSEFLSLHDELAAQVGAPPPEGLPQKSWFSSTISNPDLTEKRRKGLEAYLRAINESEDGRWRNTSAWRSFLNLPSNTASATSSSAAGLHEALTAPGAGGGPITDPTVWIDNRDEMKKELQQARLYLSQRDQATTAQGQHENSANAKKCLVKAGTKIAALDEGLKRLTENDSDWSMEKLGKGELRRRRDVLSWARQEKDGLETILNSLATQNRSSGMGQGAGASGAAATIQDKAGLFSGARTSQQSVGGRRVLGGPAQETDRTRELDNVGVLQLRQQQMQEQDMDVADLGKVVARLKAMGTDINDELAFQNALLDRNGEDADRLGGKIDIAKKRTSKIR
ncbi:MAG: hypothetical protein M1819_006181 [Sarea resinae]|nr:MAG: hypothetical protein M1819_006181 [Sarea resinae]